MARQKLENGIMILKNIIFRKNKNKIVGRTEENFEYYTINPEDFLLSFAKSFYKGKEENFIMSKTTRELLSVVTEMLDSYPYDKVTFDSDGLLCMSSNEKFYNLSVVAGNILRNLTEVFKDMRHECNAILPKAQTKAEQDFVLDMLTNCLQEEQALAKAVQESQIYAVLLTKEDKVKKINEYEAQVERENIIYTETMSDYYKDEDIYSTEEGRHDTLVTMSPPVYFNKR